MVGQGDGVDACHPRRPQPQLVLHLPVQTLLARLEAAPAQTAVAARDVVPPRVVGLGVTELVVAGDPDADGPPPRSGAAELGLAPGAGELRGQLGGELHEVPAKGKYNRNPER